MSVEEFDLQGFLKVRLLDAEFCKSLRSHILGQLQTAKNLPESQQVDRFSTIRKRTNRWDLKLLPSPLVVEAMQSILETNDFLAETLAPLCRCDASEVLLVEFGALVSNKGAPAQEWHADTAHTGPMDPDCICCFITLQDTPFEMGPTEIIPETHTPEFHSVAMCSFPKGVMPAYVCPKTSDVGYEKAGEACVMDCRLYHRGGANNMDEERVVFYFTIRSALIPRPGGFLYTILPDLRDKPLCEFMIK